MLTENFFQVDGVDSKYDNIVYWVVLFDSETIPEKLTAAQFRVPLVIQYSREGQMSWTVESPVGDAAFRKQFPVRLFCPVQCAGRWDPLPFFGKAFGPPAYISQVSGPDPIGLVAWSGTAKREPSWIRDIRYLLGSFAERRAVRIARVVRTIGLPFCIVAASGWSAAKGSRRLPVSARHALKQHRFVYVDRG